MCIRDRCYGSGHTVRAGELPVLHKLCNITHPIPPVFCCAPVIFPYIFLSLLFYQSGQFSQDARENRSFCVRIRFSASKCKLLYLYIFHKQMYPTSHKKKAAAVLPFRKFCSGCRFLTLFLQRKDDLFRKELALFLQGQSSFIFLHDAPDHLQLVLCGAVCPLFRRAQRADAVSYTHLPCTARC